MFWWSAIISKFPGIFYIYISLLLSSAEVAPPASELLSSGFSRKFSFCERLSVNLHTKCKKQNWDKSIFGEWSTHRRKCIYTAHLGGDVLQQFRFPDQSCYYQDKMSSRLSFNEMSNFSPDTKLRHSQDWRFSQSQSLRRLLLASSPDSLSHLRLY